MAELLLGISIGIFMYAYVNHRYVENGWIRNRGLLWLGGSVLALSILFFFL